jgi:serine/threonine protein kinase
MSASTIINYVVKKLRLADSSERDKENIENELKLLQKLRHPNIISYKDNFIDKEGNLWIVMVYCKGGDMLCEIRVTKESRTFS